MNKLVLALVFMFPVSLIGQEFNVDDHDVLPVEVVDVSPEVIEDDLFVDNFEDETEVNLEELKSIADEIKALADEMRKLSKDSNLMKMTYDEAELSGLSIRVGNLEVLSNDWVTRDEVTEIVKEEVKKYVELTVKSQDGVKKETVKLTQEDTLYNEVKVPGFAGTFQLAPGEVITHIDGVPVNPTRYSTRTNPVAYSSNYYVQGTNYRNGWRVRVSQPGNCRVVNGVMVCN